MAAAKYSKDGTKLINVPKNIETFVIPDNVTKIGNGAFKGCASLQSITIPKGVTQIDECAFKSCESLQKVTIDNQKMKFGGSVFEDCTQLEEVISPKPLDFGIVYENFKNTPYLEMRKEE